MGGFDIGSFHAAAVETPSHERVTAMRELLVETLTVHDCEPRIDEAGNLRVWRGAPEPTTHLALNTHMDTVPPHVPLERDGDLVRGRGACDAKGPLAAMVAAFLGCEPGPGRVSLLVTPDEERLSTGAAHLVGHGETAEGAEPLAADGYIVGEPTGLDVCPAAKGRFEAVVELAGVAAHAADPTAGESAVLALGPVLEAIATFDERAGPGTHATLGGPTLAPTMVDGGGATNQIPASSTLTLDRRSVPPETAEGFRTAMSTHLREAVPAGVDVQVRLAERPTPFLEAFATPETSPLVQTLQAAAGTDLRAFPAATEASYFAADAPTVVFGPGRLTDEDGAVAHATREYVRLSAVERAATVLEETLTALL